MPKRTQLYRVNATTMNSLTGLNGEVIVNTTRKSLHVHDGAMPGGYEAARADLSNVSAATNAADGKMTAALVAAIEALQVAVTTDLLDRTALSGTAVDINVPSWARKVILQYVDWGFDAASSPIIQLKSGTLKTSGYSGYGFDTNAGVLNGAAAGFSIGWGNAAYVHTGQLELMLRRDDNSSDYQWSGVLQGYRYDGVSARYSIIGNYVLSGLTQAPIEQIRCTSASGTANFDSTGYVYARFEK